MLHRFFLALSLVVSLFLIYSCVTPGSRTPAQLDLPQTVVQFKHVNDLIKFAGNIPNTDNDSQVKFVMPEFQISGDQVIYLNPTYFLFHDQWAMQSLLQLKDPRAVYPTLGNLTVLPSGISRLNDRFVYDRFYQSAVKPDREYGLGSIIFSERNQRPRPRILAFDMVFNDQPQEADVRRMYDRLSVTLNDKTVSWLPRSEAQNALADKLRTDPFWKERIVSYDDFIMPGEIKVYSGSTVAGRLKYFAKGTFNPSQVSSEDVILLHELPDELPPVQGIITSIPQTELSHLNILARGRGTLNIHVADKVLFNSLVQKSKSSRAVGFSVNHEKKLLVSDLTSADYAKYRSFFTKKTFNLAPYSTSTMDDVYRLETLKDWSAERVVRTVGGKASGMTHILRTSGVYAPPQPLGISVKGYQEHFASMKELMRKVLADERFMKDPKVRYLALEGPKKFRLLYPASVGVEPFKSLLSGGESSPLGDVVQKSGVKNMIEDAQLNPKLLAQVTSLMAGQFPTVPVGQGFRFRSSADVEDIPGFVGAGLYDSFTGYLNPDNHAPTAEDQKKTVNRAIKKVWASYWNYRAFEEKELSRIDHLSGSMAVMIHPNAPEQIEKANGVLTIRWDRSGYSEFYEVDLNVQKGETSVVRPDGSFVTPQIIKVRLFGGPPYVMQNQGSNQDGKILSEPQFRELIGLARKIIDEWVKNENLKLLPENKNNYYTLDLEYKLVPKNWFNDMTTTGGLVFLIKQARPLLSQNDIPKELKSLPAPRALLAEATRIIKRTASGEYFDFETVEMYKADTPYDGAFNVYVLFKWKKDFLDFKKGETLRLNHSDLTGANHGFMHHGPWDLSFAVKEDVAKKFNFVHFTMMVNGSFSIYTPKGESVNGATSQVITESLYENASTWLTRLICLAQPVEMPEEPGFNIGIGSPGADICE